MRSTRTGSRPRRRGLRRVLRRQRRSAAAGRRPEGRVLLFVGTKTGEPTAALLPGIVKAALDALPIAQAHALGRRRRRIRAAGALGRDAARHDSRRLRDSRHRRRQAHARPSLPCAEADRARAPGEVRGGAAKAHVVADFADRRERIRSGAVAPRKRRRRGRDRRRRARRSHRAGRMAGAAGRRLRAALPRAAAGSADRDDAGSPALFPGARCAREAAADFIAVANIESRDPEKVRAGNERVVRPRLADAAFFWDTDRQPAARSPAPRCSKRDVPGQARLAADKTERVGRSPGRSPSRSARRPALRAARRGAQQVRPADADGRRIPRAAGRHGQVLRAARRRAA